MNIKGKVVLVTGANGGIGKALIQSLAARGAAKIYVAARQLSSLESTFADLNSDSLVPVQLDITNQADIDAAAEKCSDVEILINNAGINRGAWLTAPTGMAEARAEMEVNYFGTLAVSRAFAPVLAAQGGGAMISVSSIIGQVAMPINGTYCASKAALHSMLQSLRGELAPKNIQVVGVYPGPVDTRMTAGLEMPKATPQQVADSIFEAFEGGAEDIYPDPMSQAVSQQLREDAKATEKQFSEMIPA